MFSIGTITDRDFSMRFTKNISIYMVAEDAPVLVCNPQQNTVVTIARKVHIELSTFSAKKIYLYAICYNISERKALYLNFIIQNLRSTVSNKTVLNRSLFRGLR